ncbi:MAG: TonB-dependent receptor, partial [Bacteroidales bacterium]|nr:TonB-dependent receptor [Bacteroidales bacterium]
WGDDLDWAAPMSRVGKRTDLSVSAGGGNAKSDYFVSFNYLNDDAWMRRSFTDRMTVRANINFSPIKWLRMGTNILGSLVHSYNQSWSGDGTTNPFYTARIIGSIYPVHLHDQLTGEYILDANGNKIWDTGGQEIDGVSYPRRPAASGNRNIVAEIMLDDMQYKRLSLQTRTYAEIMFLNDFKFTVSANIVYSPYSGYSYSSNKIGANAAAANPEERGASSRSERTNSYETYQQLLSYNKVLADKHEINAVIGHENFETFTKQVTANRTGQIMDGNIELSNFINISSLPNSTTDEHRTEGYFARANYSYDKGRFNVEGSFRRDGTSKFHRDIRWGTFGSIGAGWTVTREDFMQQLNWINNLKLRASYGSNGNLEGISNYAWQDVYFLNHNNQNEPGYYMDPEAANQFLTWEKLVQFSVAVDYALFNSRIKGSVEFFNKVNEDLVFRVIMPSSTGMTSQMQNIGSLYNRGVEIDISGDIIRNSTLTWNVGFTAATLRNRITRMPDNNPELLSGNKKLMLGHSIYDFWLRDWYGVDPRDGAPVYTYNPETSWSEGTCRVMADGTEVTTDISKALYNYVGSSIPDLYGTLRTFLYYKGFSLNVNFSYQIGGKTYDTVHQTLTQAGRYGYAIHKDLVNRWQKPGDITDVPRMDNTNYSVYTTTSTRYLTNASYLFLHSANLSYALPSNLTEKLKLSSLVVNLSGENLLLFSERKGLNPIESFGGTTSYQYSPSRVITLGLTLTL